MELRASVQAVKALAHRAGQGISMDPTRYGDHLLQDLENGLTAFLEQIPDGLQEEYEKRYIAKYSEWLSAMSRCYSVMVTGPANFNSRRHEKMNNYERAAWNRFDEWRDKVIKRVNRQQRLVGWEEVERLQNKLEKLTELQELMKAANKIVRNRKLSEVEQHDELEALGISEKNIIELMSPPEYRSGKKGFMPFQLSNNLAAIKATEEAIKRHSAMAQTEDREVPFEGGKVELCFSEERIRIRFDSIPDEVMRSILKHSAFKWSPKSQAWQRQLTSNAVRATSRVLGIEL